MSRRLALLLVLVPIAATAAPRTRGKVVRVERARGGKVPPKVCDIRSDRWGTCLGSQPEVGDVVTILDEGGIIASARIIEVAPYTSNSNTQPCETVWNVRTEVVRGDLASMTMRTIGLVDRELHPDRAHMITRDRFPPPPSGRDEDAVVVAVDRDGDRTADLVITQSQCEGSPGGPCIDQWSRVGGKMIRVAQTNFASCNF